MPNQKELVELLLEGKIDEFKERYQSFLDQMPKSSDATSAPAKKEFFHGYFLGMLSSLPNIPSLSTKRNKEKAIRIKKQV